jgi:hypothetical protein
MRVGRAAGAYLSIERDHPPIKTFYSRLRDAGKLENVAGCAAARKLLHVAWAVVTALSTFG